MIKNPKLYKQLTTGIKYKVGDLYGYPDSLIRGRVAAAYKESINVLLDNQDKNILDFGSGRGHGVASIHERLNPKRLVSLDAEPTYIEVAQKPLYKYKNIRFVCTDNLSSFKDNSFDIIFCMHVVEHIANPGVLIKDFYRVLRKGGSIVLATPDRENLVGNSPHDKQTYNDKELEALLKEVGFKSVKILYMQADNIATQIHKRKQKIGKHWPLSVKFRDKIVPPKTWDAGVLRLGITRAPLTEKNFSLTSVYSKSSIDLQAIGLK